MVAADRNAVAATTASTNTSAPTGPDDLESRAQGVGPLPDALSLSWLTLHRERQP
jgi:hypothetical protein